MNIGMVIGRIGGVDGVALEASKWADVLRSLGHRVFILAGQYEKGFMNPSTDTLVPEISPLSPESFWSQKKAFFFPDADPQELREHLNLYSGIIREKIGQWVDRHHISLLISENASSLPSCLELGLAIHRLVNERGIRTITHDHEFSWDRGDRFHSPHKEINDYLTDIFPLRSPYSVHAVINTHSAMILNERYGRNSFVVPNVMDFSSPFGIPTPENERLIDLLGYRKEDLLLFQVTPIIRKKGIHTAIRLLHELGNPRVKLVITGNFVDDAGSAYYHELVELAHDLQVEDQVSFAHGWFHSRGLTGTEGTSLFSLSDAYATATACTYFSTREGFGNSFVEAILARKPVFINNYRPVYMDDIGSKGFQTVMIENGELTREAVQQMADVLYHPERARDMAMHNYQLGKKYFSYETLRENLQLLIEQASD